VLLITFTQTEHYDFMSNIRCGWLDHQKARTTKLIITAN